MRPQTWVRLSARSRCALRGMRLLAGGGTFFAARQAAVRGRLPVDYLAKILPRLVRSGLLVSRRGPNGGYALAVPARRIHVSDILAAAEGPLGADGAACPFGCASGRRCGCVLKAACERANADLWRIFRRTRLSDLDAGRGPVGARPARRRHAAGG